MATRTSTTTGNFNVGSTWVGGVAPVPGDTAIIAATHNVTVSANQTIGTNTPGAAAITINASGTLTVAPAVTLVVRGDIVNNGTYSQGAGAILEVDASATTPSTTNYRFRPTAAGSVISINGTAGARCTVRSNVGGGTGSFFANALMWNVTASYCDFLRLGTASIASIQLREGVIDLNQCVFDTCGTIETYFESDTLNAKFVHVTMKNTTGTYSIFHGNSPLALTTGTRVMTSCVFDKSVQHTFYGYTITDCLFTGDPPFSSIGSGAIPWAGFSNNLIVATGSTEATVGGPSVLDCYYLQTTTGNPHYFAHPITCLVKGCIFEYTGTTDDGDCNLMGAPSGPITITVEHCLGLPNAGGGSPGTMFSMGGSANLTVIARHNTWLGGNQACCSIGETYAGHAGILAQFRDNLCWDTVATTYKLIDLSSTVLDVVASANCHHNAGWHMLAGSNGKGYHNLDFSSGLPGTADVDGTDPNFVDPTRDLASWDTSVGGGTGSVTRALTELRKKNDASGYNTAYTIAALMTYVKAGFVPQAAAMQAASDSVAPSMGWIGALEGSVVTPPTPPAGWTLVADIAAASTDGEDVTTPAINTTGAKLLVAVIGAFLGPGPTGMLDSKGNTWTPRTIYTSSTAAWLRTFYVASPIVSATGVTDHTFTTVGGPGNVPSICVTAWSGAKLGAPYDQENGAGNDSAVTIQAGSGATPTEANELVIAGAMIRHSQSITGITGTGFTLLHNVGASGLAMRTGLAYAIQTTPALANPTWTFDSPQYCAANLATFKAEPVVVSADSDLTLLGVG